MTKQSVDAGMRHPFGRQLAIAALVFVLHGCATSGPVGGVSPAADTFTVPFGYKGFGAGPQPVVGTLELNPGSETSTISRAVLEAMQGLQLSVVDPPPRLDVLLAADTPWKTDVAPVGADVIADYNRNFPKSPLPTDRLYGVQYSGMYSVVENEVRFRLESSLYQRGAASDFKPYPRSDYSGNFFFDRVKAAIMQQLRKPSPGASP